MSANLAAEIEQLSYQELKSRLGTYYGAELITDIEKNFGKGDVQELARKTVEMGVAFDTPVFDGADYEKEIQPLLKSLNLPINGTYKMYDGRTGDLFDQPVTVGYIYMMKLNHLADDNCMLVPLVHTH